MFCNIFQKRSFKKPFSIFITFKAGEPGITNQPN